MTIIFLLITLLVHFYKADFVNLTICCVAIYLLSFANAMDAKYFRYMVFGIILTFAYDLYWFWEKYGEYSGDGDVIDGGVESKVRRFSLTMAWISFFYKIVMSFVYWKASIDYAAIIDERSKIMRL